MKKFVLTGLIFAAVLIAGCSKSRQEIPVPTEPPAQNPPQNQTDILATQFAAATFSVSVPFEGKAQEGSLLLIKIPVNQKTTLRFNNPDTQEFKDTKWFIDNVEKAAGNNFEVNFNEIGQHTITLSTTSISTGREFSKTSIIYVYKYVSVSVETILPDYVCGEIEVFGTSPVGKLPKLAGTVDCTKPANISFGPLQLAIFSNANSLLFLHLFKADKNSSILIPYSADSFSGSQLNNYSPGVYKSGATSLTIH